MRGINMKICLFGASSEDINKVYFEQVEELGKLVANGANKTCDKNEIAFSLVYAPEEENSNYEEEGLLTEMGNERKEPVKDRVTNALKEIKEGHTAFCKFTHKGHFNSPLSLFFDKKTIILQIKDDIF